jgi:hypothetical protein
MTRIRVEFDDSEETRMRLPHHDRASTGHVPSPSDAAGLSGTQIAQARRGARPGGAARAPRSHLPVASGALPVVGTTKYSKLPHY